MPPVTTAKPDYKKYTTDQFIAELEAALKSSADNFSLATLAQDKCDETAKEIVILQDKLAVSETDLDNVSSALTSLKLENATLVKVNDELTVVVETLTKQIESKKTIADAAQEIAEKKTPPIPTSTFTVEGTSYKFISPVFVYQKNRIVAAEAIDNQELLNELVSAKVGSIVPA